MSGQGHAGPSNVPNPNVQANMCHQCGQVLDSAEQVQEHMKHVHGEGAFVCPICHMGFRVPQLLQLHQFGVHTAEGRVNFNCNHCGKRFHDFGVFRAHLESESCGNIVIINTNINMSTGLEAYPFTMSMDVNTSPPIIAIIPHPAPEQPIDLSCRQRSYDSPARMFHDVSHLNISIGRSQQPNAASGTSGQLNVATEPPASSSTSRNAPQSTPPAEDTGNIKIEESAPEPTLRRSKRQRTEPRRL